METYYGYVHTPADAIILFEASRVGILPRIKRRLSDKDRMSIRPGSVFVWDEQEAGMRRWTDGRSWSESRIRGSFLAYRELEAKPRRGRVSQGSVSKASKVPEDTRRSHDGRGQETDKASNGYRHKPDGLMKKSFNITTATGQHLHLINYYSRSRHPVENLLRPTTDPALSHVYPPKGLYPERTAKDQETPPKITCSTIVCAAYLITSHPIGPCEHTTHQHYSVVPCTCRPTHLATPPALPIPCLAQLSPDSASRSGPNEPPQDQRPPRWPPPAYSLLPLSQGSSNVHERLPCPESAVRLANWHSATRPIYPCQSSESMHSALLAQADRRVYGQSVADEHMPQTRILPRAMSPSNRTCHSPQELKQPHGYSLQQFGHHIGAPPKPTEPVTIPGIDALMRSTLLDQDTPFVESTSGWRNANRRHTGPVVGSQELSDENMSSAKEDTKALGLLDRVFMA